MMLFSKKKKLQRDRNAGLVFRWRGGYAENFGGSTIAFLVTSVVFAAGFVMLNVYAKPNTVPSRYRASMIQLSTMDDDLTWWVERNSPFLPAWSQHGVAESNARVNDQLMEQLRESNRGAYLYEDIEMQQVEIDNEGIYTLNNRWLPSVTRFNAGDGDSVVAAPEVDWKLNVKVSDTLYARLPNDLEYGSWVSQRWRGRSVRLMIAVDASGKVLSVNPAEWNESKTVKEFENWVYTIAFKPADKDKQQMMTGVMTLTYAPVIKASDKEEGKEEKP